MSTRTTITEGTDRFGRPDGRKVPITLPLEPWADETFQITERPAKPSPTRPRRNITVRG